MIVGGRKCVFTVVVTLVYPPRNRGVPTGIFLGCEIEDLRGRGVPTTPSFYYEGGTLM